MNFRLRLSGDGGEATVHIEAESFSEMLYRINEWVMLAEYMKPEWNFVMYQEYGHGKGEFKVASQNRTTYGSLRSMQSEPNGKWIHSAESFVALWAEVNIK